MSPTGLEGIKTTIHGPKGKPPIGSSALPIVEFLSICDFCGRFVSDGLRIGPIQGQCGFQAYSRKNIAAVSALKKGLKSVECLACGKGLSFVEIVFKPPSQAF